MVRTLMISEGFSESFTTLKTFLGWPECAARLVCHPPEIEGFKRTKLDTREALRTRASTAVAGWKSGGAARKIGSSSI